MWENIIADIICDTFERHVGRNQCNKPEPKAMLIDFRVHVDHSKEDGYRHAQLIIYGHTNYVQVWKKETWDVIPIEDLEDEDDGGPKPGKDYVKGETEWKLMSEHDSCWRSDGVQRFLWDIRDKVSILSRIGQWYEIIPWKYESREDYKRRLGIK